MSEPMKKVSNQTNLVSQLYLADFQPEKIILATIKSGLKLREQ